MIAPFLAMLLAVSAGGDLAEAERAYRAGQFRAAHAAFTAALSEPGVPRGPLLYDLGNCAYRLGSYAEATFHYRRAQLLLPRDPELAFNLALASRHLGIDPPSRPILSFLTGRELLSLVTALQTAGLLGFLLLRRRRFARRCAALLVVLGLAGAVRLVQAHWFPGAPEGVVLTEELGLRSEPRDGLPVAHRLKAGDLVVVVERSDHWLKVTHGTFGGWTERAGVGVVE
jgi:tetratricopeptide (TPR) repeat protein